MELVAQLWDFVVHLDAHLAAFVAQHGAWVYGLLFLIVFCETGLVVTPFLPGDSLLFVAGTLAAAGGMDIYAVIGTLLAAVKSNLTLVIIGIVLLSISPGLIAWARGRSVQREGG